jgi:ESCRT-I complex subunit TSG101
MSLPLQVANWLFNVLQPQYLHKQVAYSHIYQFLAVHLKRNLRFRIRTQVYTSSESGNSELLINLFGSITTGVGDVPVEIWVPLNYPYVDGVPLVYIVPDHANQLYLRPGNHVDTQGRFYHPYLASWYYECTGESTLNKFNLLELINVIQSVVTLDIPIQQVPPETPQSVPNIASQSLPPKPAKVPLSQLVNPRDPQPAVIPQYDPQPSQALPFPQNNPQASSSKALGIPRDPPPFSGPPLPVKSGFASDAPPAIPLKYQNPLPLPNEQQSTQMYPISPPHAASPAMVQNYTGPRQNGNYLQDQNGSYLQDQNGSYLQDQNGSYIPNQEQNPQISNYSPSSTTHTTPVPIQHVQNTPPIRTKNVQNTPINNTKNTKPKTTIDLMDDNLPIPTVPQVLHRELLEQLSNKINAYLQQDNCNQVVAQVNENSTKFSTLYNQLNHHYQQAQANSRHLEDHMNYLSQQLQQITKLDHDLAILDQLNNSQPDKVYTSSTTHVLLDDLIIPDLPLVKQLYDIVLEMKAIKDTISLIGGGFDSQSEIINDSNMDMCVKTVRNLGRELFWLELTKNEVAKVMSLH